MFIEPSENEPYKEYISRILNSRENKKDENEYQELHHITPRCMGGKDDDAADYVGISNTNIISYLSGKEGRKSAGKHPETKVPLHWLYA